MGSGSCLDGARHKLILDALLKELYLPTFELIARAHIIVLVLQFSSRRRLFALRCVFLREQLLVVFLGGFERAFE